AAGIAASGVLAAGAARLAARAGGGVVRSAATLSGTVTAAYQSGGRAGVGWVAGAQTPAGAPRAVDSPVRDAYREGAAVGIRATTPPPGDGSDGSPPPSAPQTPPWATALARRQRVRDATFAAAQALREGDRPAGAPGPDLKDKS